MNGWRESETVTEFKEGTLRHSRWRENMEREVDFILQELTYMTIDLYNIKILKVFASGPGNWGSIPV